MNHTNVYHHPLRYHFIGIGGISMSGLAEILLYAGHTITGSDMAESATVQHLRKLGIQVTVPHSAANISEETDVVVYTAAIRADNPEYIEATRQKKSVLERAQLLGQMLTGYANSVCVAGSHGKTSASALMTEIMLEAELDPTISVGGRLNVLDDANYRVGNSPYFLLESCEFNGSFHHFFPQVAIILNIDADHLDYYGTYENVVAAFQKFAGNIKPGGTLVVEKSTGRNLRPVENVKIVTFGIKDADYTAANIKYNAFGESSFDIQHMGNTVATVNLPLPGEYSILNALAVFAAAISLGVAPTTAAKALSSAKGVKRRFEYKGEYNGVTIIDDYAHHPTEIISCLKAARDSFCENEKHGRIFCVFHPHTYTRTRNHLAEFATAFKDADYILLLPIYPAREPFDPSISSLHLQEGIIGAGGNCTHFHDFASAVSHLKEQLQPGDMLITMGAGEAHIVGEALLSL